MHSDFLSCDWGTSSFRLRLVSEGKVVASIEEPVGVRKMYDSGDGPEGFERYLSTKLSELANGQKFAPLPPLIISGMASSTIGWKELPYARAPFGVDGGELVVDKLEWPAPAWLGATYLVSGVATETEMMRGEECQIIGLLARPEMQKQRENSLVILPGSHSKHARVQAGKVVNFHTYMTGELFHALANHTVLRATVGSGDLIPQLPEEFLLGVQAAQNDGLPRSLFQARTRGVLDQKNREQNAAFLSGMLIASELLDLPTLDCPVVVVGNELLCGLYQMTMLSLRGVQFMTAPGDYTTAGHAAILANLR